MPDMPAVQYNFPKRLVISVTTDSAIPTIADAIVRVLCDEGQLELHAFDGETVDQAVRALILSRDRLCEVGVDLVCTVFLKKLPTEAKATVIRFLVYQRPT
jgi:stage V sporulation protein SpoVS